MLTIQEISDRLEIHDLIHRYAEIVDGVTQNGHVRELRDEIFTEDAIIDSTQLGYREFKVEEFMEVFETDVTPEQIAGLQHVNGSHQVKLDGDRATGRIMCIATAVMPGPIEKLNVTAVKIIYNVSSLRHSTH